MFGRTQPALSVLPDGLRRIASKETTPVRYLRYMDGQYHSKWFDGMIVNPYQPYRHRPWYSRWPACRRGWERSPKLFTPLYEQQLSREALVEAQKTIPDWFHTSMVPRPPQRIKAQSEGIVGNWYGNFWTLHCMKFQCLLANVPWKHGERRRMRSNYDEPFYYVDVMESQALRDHRSKWINMHRSMAGMTKKIKDVDDERRFVDHKRLQDQFWSDRRVLLNRVRSMRGSGAIETADDLPVKTFNFRAFE